MTYQIPEAVHRAMVRQLETFEREAVEHVDREQILVQRIEELETALNNTEPAWINTPSGLHYHAVLKNRKWREALK